MFGALGFRAVGLRLKAVWLLNGVLPCRGLGC